ncbi:hypothetical protein CHS0354_016915 [Potamilus streckersoni]|uniref:Uncharacterized protein n=1 Tax=Potamilus streckersoni TaxID=2493646 RepID=A0AAE0S721_9BIVA|nr:hypothetical protein CHS0354_016915 [Potamilus streckersoni]
MVSNQLGTGPRVLDLTLAVIGQVEPWSYKDWNTVVSLDVGVVPVELVEIVSKVDNGMWIVIGDVVKVAAASSRSEVDGTWIFSCEYGGAVASGFKIALLDRVKCHGGKSFDTILFRKS